MSMECNGVLFCAPDWLFSPMDHNAVAVPENTILTLSIQDKTSHIVLQFKTAVHSIL